MSALVLAVLLASSPCATAQDSGAAARCLPVREDWRTIATEDDRRRLREWRDAWQDALDDAQSAHGAEIAGQAALLEPDAALARPMPPAGDYDCRTIKLGTPSDDSLTYIAYPAFRCRISVQNGVMRFTKLNGSQRPIGRLFNDNDRR